METVMPAQQAQSLAAVTAEWLARLEKALGAADAVALEGLFHPDCHWRDVLALTWRIRTVSGRSAVVDMLRTQGSATKPMNFRLDERRTPPRKVMRAGKAAIEALFSFET